MFIITESLYKGKEKVTPFSGNSFPSILLKSTLFIGEKAILSLPLPPRIYFSFNATKDLKTSGTRWKILRHSKYVPPVLLYRIGVKSFCIFTLAKNNKIC